MKTWLVLDCNYLCHRAWHSTGQLSHGDVGTGVVYGFLRDIITLQDQHATKRIVFCWDHGRSFRYADYPDYKAKRNTKNTSQSEADEFFRKELRRQCKLLRRDYLPRLGYKNIFYQKGYEGDDIIASVVQNLPEHNEAIIVSNDHDMYQLLTDQVMCWNPTLKEMTTLKSFTQQYGVSPEQWVDVKAIAGCGTDDIAGIEGIGEITAAKFMSGRLKNDSKAFQKIVMGNDIWKRNLPLVRLPYPDVNTFELQRDEVTADKWRELADELGMKSLRNAIAVPEGQRRDHAKTKKEKTKPKPKGFGIRTGNRS